MSLDWWRDARFGMFIHWGIYSGLEGFWKGEETNSLGEWLQCHKKIPLKEYSKWAEKLTLENFDADFYVKLAKDAGMKYIVLTAKHHDGFAMYDSAVSDYNIVKMGPSHRDPLRELAIAAQRHGLKICCYYSQSLDWEDPDGEFNDWDYDPAQKDLDRFLENKCKEQLTEILTNYGPIGLIWFDVPSKINYKRGKMLRDLVKSLQPKCIVSGRISEEPGLNDYGSFGDNHIPLGKLEGDWETPGTLNHTWGYKRNDHNWKTPEEITETLCQLLSKGTNYLLNIGPRADGSIPEASVELLRKIGTWIHSHEDAVFGTLASPFPSNFDWGWSSRKGNRVYLYIRSGAKFSGISGLRTKIKSIKMLNATEAQVEFKQSNLALEISLSGKLPDEFVHVLELTLEAAPQVIEFPCQQPDGSISIPAYLARLHIKAWSDKEEGIGLNEAQEAESSNLRKAKTMAIDFAGTIINWFDTENYASWEFIADKTGEYDVELRTVGKKYRDWIGGHKMTVKIDDESCSAELHNDGVVKNANSRYFPQVGSRIGKIALKRSGQHNLTLKADCINPAELADLEICELVLTPAKSQ